MKKYIMAAFYLVVLLNFCSVEAYTQKAPYEGYGKASKVNGLPKIKAIKGYTKQTSKGYVRVNPYARSKI